MKDFSFFLLKNSLGAKMRKGFRSSCNGDGSTSILNQRKTDGLDYSCTATQSLSGSPFINNATSGETRTTLEEMILQLEFEEKIARQAKADEYIAEMQQQRRMSCVDNSDILRSARNALNQYPRFSLDGKDAMYRSSFRNPPPIITAGARKSICCNRGLRGSMMKEGLDSELRRTPCFPPILGGESVVWCKPGVVAKLMGLEAIPVPVEDSYRCKEKWSSVIKKQNMRKRGEKYEMERRKLVRDKNGGNETKRGVTSSCSRTGYCVMKPIAVVPANDGGGWPIRGLR